MTLDAIIFVAEKAGSCDPLITRCHTPDWRRSDVGRATVLVRDAPLLESPARRLVVLGRLFQASTPVHCLSTSVAAAAEESEGRFLVERTWGPYLALWQQPRSAAIAVLRDPSGAHPLFYSPVQGGHILFTRLETVLAHRLVQPAIDWDAIAHGLRFRQLPTARTALSGVRELLAGERIVFAETGPHTTQLWSPLTCRPNRPDDPPSPEQLRDTVFATAKTLTADVAPLLLELSGGLDSSIIACGLAASDAEWRAATIVTPGRDGDERDYAQLVTDHLGSRLDPVPLAPDAVDLLVRPAHPSVRPSGYGMLTPLDRALSAAADRAGARALVSGTGGDNVFAYLRSAVPVVDSAVAGRWRALGETVDDVALLTGVSRWSVLSHAARYALRDRLRPHRWTETMRFLGPRRPTLELHPWLVRGAGVLPGRRARAALLLRARGIMDASDRARDRPMLFPLMAQPVIETCLAIPTWRWVEGGRDRAVARRAFARDLPPAIVQRRSKGRLESLLLPAYARQRGDLVARLRDGHLHRHGIVDLAAIERATARPVVADDPDYFRLLELTDAELWVEDMLA